MMLFSQKDSTEGSIALYCDECRRPIGVVQFIFIPVRPAGPKESEPAKAPEKPALPEPEKKMVRKVQLEP